MEELGATKLLNRILEIKGIRELGATRPLNRIRIIKGTMGIRRIRGNNGRYVDPHPLYT